MIGINRAVHFRCDREVFSEATEEKVRPRAEYEPQSLLDPFTPLVCPALDVSPYLALSTR